jgi:hypothetical protein
MSEEVKQRRPSFTLPGLEWEVFDTAQGWCMRFPDGHVDWPTPRERQIVIAFRDSVERAAKRAFDAVQAVDGQPYSTLQKATSVAASVRGLAQSSPASED